MRELMVPATTTVGDQENLTDAVWANAERFAASVSFRRRSDGGWIDVTAKEFADEVTAVAMIDRLVHHAEILSLKGDSFRLRGKDAAARPRAVLAETDG